jgi:hypothetical protein
MVRMGLHVRRVVLGRQHPQAGAFPHHDTTPPDDGNDLASCAYRTMFLGGVGSAAAFKRAADAGVISPTPPSEGVHQ